MQTKDKYLELLQKFPPRPIYCSEDLEATQEVIDALLDQPELTKEENDYLNVLGTLVYEYEETLKAIPDIYGVELLKCLIEDRGLKQKDLIPIFKTESIVREVISGKRQLTTRHIQELSQFFGLPSDVFFPH